MYRSIRVVSPRRIAQFNWPPTTKWSSTLSRPTFAHALRVLAPTLFALTFAGVAHAQGTMDFSGAQTLMGTFNWRNDYAGIEQWSRFIQDDHYAFHAELYKQHEQFAKQWDNNLRLQGFEKQTPSA